MGIAPGAGDPCNVSWLERVLLRRWAVGALAAVACLIVVILVWVGWVAVRQWQQSLLLLADRQADDASERFVVDLTRDMQAVQRLVLLSPALDAFTSRDPVPDPTYGAVNLVASAFARYSYPEAFFIWNRERAAAGLVSSTAAIARCAGTPGRGPGAVSGDRRRARLDRARRCCSGSRTKRPKGGGSSLSRSRTGGSHLPGGGAAALPRRVPPESPDDLRLRR